ncbi:MAG: hypothetical protein H7X94_15445 [Vallitaleaceae bacterium]|nr:hypothetical protein [Vallitaleaceae bacterium]
MKKKSKLGFFKGMFVLVLLALIVFLGADNFGFDWFNFKIDLSQNSQQDIQSVGEESSGKQAYVNIVISNENISFNEKKVTLEELKKALVDYPSTGYIVNLIDHWALNTTFTEVETYLKEQNYRMVITELRD